MRKGELVPRERGRHGKARRGREERSPSRPSEEQREGEPRIGEESEAPGVLPSWFTFRRRHRQGGRGKAGEKAKGPPPKRERTSARPVASGASSASVSPLSFWRRGQPRPHRQRPLPRRGPRRWWRRLVGLYFPPWVPVVAIIIIVFGILGFLFFAREVTGAPRVGRDNWSASYRIEVCGQQQPNVPAFSGGVATDGHGDIRISPQVSSEEGAGARLVKWFEYGGGKLTQSEMRIPGQKRTFKNGDKCDDGSEGVLQVFVNGEQMSNWSRYIPQNADRIRIVFGPKEEAAVDKGGTQTPAAATPAPSPGATPSAATPTPSQ